MKQQSTNPSFESINAGYNKTFQMNRLSVGLVVPIEHYSNGPVPTMQHHIKRVQLAEKLGFKAVWLRDIHFNVPSFGDAGQTYDPFVYLGFLAAHTTNIALGVASIVLPLRHPAHVAKAAASVDVLSEGRVILGVASGDRPEEYPGLNLPYEKRGEKFRESFDYIRHMSADYPAFKNDYGASHGGIDMLPKPVAGKLPLLITGASQQSSKWIDEHGDGWMLYPRDLATQTNVIKEWRARAAESGRPIKPVMEPLYVDLTENPDTPPQPIHLGLRLGAHYLRDYLLSRQAIGVNHVTLNLRFNQANIETTLERLAKTVLPEFHQK